MSLSDLRKINENGCEFRSHIDGSKHMLTPERSIEIQDLLDSNITMVLDECTAFPATPDEAASSMRRSMRWAERCRKAFRDRDGYLLFGIVQGGIYPHLREESAKALTEIGFDGYAIGRPGHRRGPAADVRRARLHAGFPARRPTALSDGCRQAERSGGRGRARHRHVRLRDADALGPHRVLRIPATAISTCAMRAMRPTTGRSIPMCTAPLAHPMCAAISII